MLEETLEILHGLWDEPDGWSFIGEHYAIDDALFRPKPASLPGAEGRPAADPRRRRGVAAVVPDRGPLRGRVQPVVGEPQGRDAEVRGARRDAPGRRTRPVDDHATPRWSGVLMGRTDDEVRGREQALLTAFGQAEAGEAWFEPRRARWIHGTPDKARASLAAFEAAGVERIMLQDFLPRDLEMIELAAESLFG